MSDRWIKLYEKAKYSNLWQNPKIWRFFEWCLLTATYKQVSIMVGHKRVTLEPGQLIFGRKKAALESGLSEQNVRSCLRTLCNGLVPELTIKVTNAFSIITIVNWGRYQGAEVSNQPTTNQEVIEVKETYIESVSDQNQREPEVNDFGCMDSFEANFSPTYKKAVCAAKAACKKNRKGFALDASTKCGLREITAAIDRGDVTFEAMFAAADRILADKDKAKWGWRGIAKNYGSYLEPDAPEPVPKPKPDWIQPVKISETEHQEILKIIREKKERLK